MCVNNPLYSAYLTTPSKDRFSVIDLLRNGQPRTFRLNCEALRYLATAGVSGITRQQLSHWPQNRDWMRPPCTFCWRSICLSWGCRPRKWILDAAAVAAYHAQTQWPVARLLVCDGAPQFTWITEEAGLMLGSSKVGSTRSCSLTWRQHQTDPGGLPGRRSGTIYRELLAYRFCSQSAGEHGQRVGEEICTPSLATKTGYWALDERIGLTRAKKTSLLMMLVLTEIPLHNNSAELDARQRVRKRKISFGPRVADVSRAVGRLHVTWLGPPGSWE